MHDWGVRSEHLHTCARSWQGTAGNCAHCQPAGQVFKTVYTLLWLCVPPRPQVPTADWDEPVLEVVLSRAFMWITNTTKGHLAAQSGQSGPTRELERFKGT